MTDSEHVTSVHPEESKAGLRVKGGSLCECGVGFDEATGSLAKPGAVHKHRGCLYCGASVGGVHDWTVPHPRMVWRVGGVLTA